MKALFSNRRFWRGILSLTFLICVSTGCGSTASPPAGIPAPVSQLLSVSNPDAGGTVTVTGGPGAVLPGADVSAANTSQGGVVKKIKNFLIRNAFAGESIAPVNNTAVAGPDGSFQLILSANIGDQIQVVQTVDGETSPPTQLTVEGKSVDLGMLPRDLAVDSQTGRIFVTVGGAENGFVYVVNFLGDTTPLSLPQPDLTFDGLPGVGGISLNSLNNRGVVVSTEENTVINFSLDLTGDPFIDNVMGPLDIDILPGEAMGVIGLEDSVIPENSIRFYDSQPPPQPDCFFSIRDSFNGSVHVATPLVEFRRDDQLTSQVLAVSEFANGTYILSKFTFDTCPVPVNQPVEQILLPPGIDPAGIASFDQTLGALVTDANSNLVQIADFDNLTLSELAVGNSPRGVVVNQAATKAYVVNNEDNSITAVNLGDFSTQTQTEVGLSPTEIGLLPGETQAVVISTADDSIVLIDLEI